MESKELYDLFVKSFNKHRGSRTPLPGPYALRRCANPDIVGDSNESAVRYLLDRAVSKAGVYQDHINDDTIDELAKAFSEVLKDNLIKVKGKE